MKKLRKAKSADEGGVKKVVPELEITKELDKVKDRLENKESSLVERILLKVLCGILIGVSAVLPGVSGGILCVIFGIYPVVMDLISHPFTNLKEKLKILMPYMFGMVIGFWGVSKMLEILLTKFEAPCTCLFIGLVAGMLPSLFVTVGKGRNRILSYLGLSISCVAVLAILVSLRAMSIEIEANFLSYIVCGIALAFSIIVPGMSFSTLLMPLGLYTPFVQGIGDFDLMVLIPAGIGVGVTFIAFARFISNLFNKHYSVAQNIVVGIVIAATAVIIPFNSFSASVLSAVINVICIAVGVAFARLISKLNKRYDGKKSMPEQNG